MDSQEGVQKQSQPPLVVPSSDSIPITGYISPVSVTADYQRHFCSQANDPKAVKSEPLAVDSDISNRISKLEQALSSLNNETEFTHPMVMYCDSFCIRNYFLDLSSHDQSLGVCVYIYTCCRMICTIQLRTTTLLGSQTRLTTWRVESISSRTDWPRWKPY